MKVFLISKEIYRMRLFGQFIQLVKKKKSCLSVSLLCS